LFCCIQRKTFKQKYVISDESSIHTYNKVTSCLSYIKFGRNSFAADLPSLETLSLSSLSLLVLGLAESLALFAALSPAAERSSGECSGAPVPMRLRRDRPPRPTRDIASNVWQIKITLEGAIPTEIFIK
jgi:hypothetical protein